MKLRLLLIVLLCCLVLPNLVSASGEDIRFESKAEIEVQQTDSKGEGILVRQPAKLVVPGTIIIYTNRFTNIGEDIAENLVITNPIPEGMVFLAGSALPESALIHYSIDDGKTFAAPEDLIIVEPDGRIRPAEALDYTHIRWTIQNPLPQRESGQVEFRARLR